jgi:phosphoadenosine phosphosulfate reductase
VRAARVLDWATHIYRGRIVLASSFGGPSGMVLVDLLARSGHDVPVYYIDTDLLFPETYALIERVTERYGIRPIAVKTELTLERQAELHGEALWARDPDRCCALRKVAPQRAFLAGFGAWITGLRREQAATRGELPFIGWDEHSGGIVKINPLADWSDGDVPYNALHDRGFPSIGCVPCTRAVAPGEDPRAGRWDGFAKTECGLHQNGRAL